MSGRTELRLDWCTHEAAKYAVERWHYSKCLPAGKIVKIGVWEAGHFIGVVLFSKGAAPQAHCQYGITNMQVCELTRVALSRHKTPVSKIVSIALRMLKRFSSGIRLVVSYADPVQNHHGGVYQAGGWTYVGITKPCTHFVHRKSRKKIHSKTLRTGRPGYASFLLANGSIDRIKTIKHKYLMPLDDEMRARIAPLAQPYPKRAGSAASGTPDLQSGRGGATPTPALSTDEATP